MRRRLCGFRWGYDMLRPQAALSPLQSRRGALGSLRVFLRGGVVSGEAGGGYFYPDSEDEYDDDPSCSLCDGQPDLQECDDPIQCCDPRCDGTWHPCTACQGTGLSKYQVIW